MTDALLTIEQVAERIGLHPETLRRAVRAGKLGCYRLQGCIRIAPAQLDAYLQENLCPAHVPTDPLSKPERACSTLLGSTETSVSAYRQARRTRLSLDKALRTSKPSLSVVQPS